MAPCSVLCWCHRNWGSAQSIKWQFSWDPQNKGTAPAYASLFFQVLNLLCCAQCCVSSLLGGRIRLRFQQYVSTIRATHVEHSNWWQQSRFWTKSERKTCCRQITMRSCAFCKWEIRLVGRFLQSHELRINGNWLYFKTVDIICNLV